MTTEAATLTETLLTVELGPVAFKGATAERVTPDLMADLRQAEQRVEDRARRERAEQWATLLVRWSEANLPDDENRVAFINDVVEALQLSPEAAAERLPDVLKSWEVTARQLADPLRREVLLARSFDDDDFVEARRPG